jgi:hypothetical protein
MKIKNTQHIVTKIWIWTTALFIALGLLSVFSNNKNLPFEFFLMASIGAGVLALISSSRAKQFDNLLEELETNRILVRWFFTRDEWSEYAEYNYQRNKSKIYKSIKEGIIFFIILFVCFIFLKKILFTNSNTTLALIIIASFTMPFLRFSVLLYNNLSRNLTKTGYIAGYVFLSTDSVLLNGDFHNWTSMDSRLEKITYVDSGIPTIISLTYSRPAGRGSREIISIKIPVPTREKAKIKEIIDELARANTSMWHQVKIMN